LRLAWLLSALFAIGGCASGLIDVDRNYSEAIPASDDTFIAREVAEGEKRHPGKSGFYPLSRGLDALGARLSLMDQAQRSLDAQYFLMKSDDAGLIFVAGMLEAADRGVRVRFILDDVFTNVDDTSLVLLDSHPNIEVRLFNPIGRGGFYYLNFLGDFKRANRRMHNKSFIVDNQIGIVGGRNIAEEYFELKTHTEFVDFDMLIVGEVAQQTSVTFDRFWNHELSVPMSAYAEKHSDNDLEKRRAAIIAALEEAGESLYAQAINSRFIKDVHDDLIELYPAKATVITDDPEKLLNKKSGDYRVLINAVTEALEKAETEVIIVTPYLIPGDGGLAFIESLRRRGIRVLIFTNSLASNNHVAVHGGYERYRKPLLRAGVELHEARASAGKEIAIQAGLEGSEIESLTLHTKGILIDRKWVFVGSLNIDPRSVDINTEMGILIESPELAGRLAENVDSRLTGISYKLELNEEGRLRWHATIDGEEVVETKEPLAGWWRRFLSTVLKIMPESQL